MLGSVHVRVPASPDPMPLPADVEHYTLADMVVEGALLLFFAALLINVVTAAIAILGEKEYAVPHHAGSGTEGSASSTGAWSSSHARHNAAAEAAQQ